MKNYFLTLISKMEIIKDIESLMITVLQLTLNYKTINYLILITKLFTRRKIFFVYFIILFFYNFLFFLSHIFFFYLSRIILTKIKNYIKQPRPYIEYENTITYFKKRKISFSFPSQSMQSLIFIYCSFNYLFANNIFIHLYFVTLTLLLSLTRMYRGLHYPHDFIFSIFYSKIFFNFCLHTFLFFSGSRDNINYFFSNKNIILSKWD